MISNTKNANKKSWLQEKDQYYSCQILIVIVSFIFYSKIYKHTLLCLKEETMEGIQQSQCFTRKKLE